jgi:hypothetical protein
MTSAWQACACSKEPEVSTARQTLYRSDGSSVVLTQNQYLSTGGEGAVYRKDQQVYKLYLEPAKAVRAGIPEKARKLSAFQHAGIAAPQDTLWTKQGEFAGLVLPFASGEALCKLFTNTWRQAHQFDDAKTAQLTRAMRDVTVYAHQHQALMVDANEMNWVVQGTNPVAIDVDSWQLPGFAATAIMPSIRDWSAKSFDEGTDWFAWAVVTFQLWAGIHPYKGTHPDFGRADLEGRMRAMASVFDSRVRLPAAARPLKDIPAALRTWYEQTFTSPLRSAPPTSFDAVTPTQIAPRLRVVQSSSAQLRIEKLGQPGSKILAAFDGFVLAQSGDKLSLWDALAQSEVAGPSQEQLQGVVQRKAVALRNASSRVFVHLQEGAIVATDLNDAQQARLELGAQRLWSANRRLFALVEELNDGLIELEVLRTGSRLQLVATRRWPVSVLSTQFFRGGFVQDCLGTPVLGVASADGELQLAAAPGLRAYKPVDGFFLDPFNVWLVALRRSDGESVRLRLELQGTRYEVREEQLCDELDLNAAASLSGVGVLREGEDLLVLKAKVSKRVVDVGLPSSLRLFSLGQGIGAFVDGQVLKLSLS